jgi:hypothetical protein
MIHPYEPPLSDAEIEARDPLVLWQQMQLLVQQRRERRVTRCVEIGLFRGDVMFPFAAS